MRVLVAEDERGLADAIAIGLEREGYAVDVAYDGEDAFVKARVYPYDLLCLDINMPGMDGRELTRRLRSEPHEDAPPPRILFLTANDGLDDRISGLDDGADDYLTKPFDFGELKARVRALLRRDAGTSGTATLTVGKLALDSAAGTASRAGDSLALTPKEFALLRYFMSHPGEVLSEGRLLTHVWDENADPATKTVRVTVMNLRRKLEASGEAHPIETIVGSGYRLKETG